MTPLAAPGAKGRYGMEGSGGARPVPAEPRWGAALELASLSNAHSAMCYVSEWSMTRRESWRGSINISLGGF